MATAQTTVIVCEQCESITSMVRKVRPALALTHITSTHLLSLIISGLTSSSHLEQSVLLAIRSSTLDNTQTTAASVFRRVRSCNRKLRELHAAGQNHNSNNHHCSWSSWYAKVRHIAYPRFLCWALHKICPTPLPWFFWWQIMWYAQIIIRLGPVWWHLLCCGSSLSLQKCCNPSLYQWVLADLDQLPCLWKYFQIMMWKGFNGGGTHSQAFEKDTSCSPCRKVLPCYYSNLPNHPAPLRGRLPHSNDPSLPVQRWCRLTLH